MYAAIIIFSMIAISFWQFLSIRHWMRNIRNEVISHIRTIIIENSHADHNNEVHQNILKTNQKLTELIEYIDELKNKSEHESTDLQQQIRNKVAVPLSFEMFHPVFINKKFKVFSTASNQELNISAGNLINWFSKPQKIEFVFKGFERKNRTNKQAIWDDAKIDFQLIFNEVSYEDVVLICYYLRIISKIVHIKDLASESLIFINYGHTKDSNDEDTYYSSTKHIAVFDTFKISIVENNLMLSHISDVSSHEEDSIEDTLFVPVESVISTSKGKISTLGNILAAVDALSTTCEFKTFKYKLLLKYSDDPIKLYRETLNKLAE